VGAERGLPGWSSLDYLQQAFWVQAASSVALEPCGDTDEQRWCLTAGNKVADNSEDLQIEADPDGSLLTRRRSSTGREQRRVKEWAYLGDGILRRRLEPSGKPGADDYVVTSERMLTYPAVGARVTDPLFLLVLAAPGGAASDGQLIVHTDLNFYTVTVTGAGEASIDVKYEVDGKTVKGPRQAVLVKLEASPVEPLADKPDFNLLGLSGVITIAYDAATGIPLQLRGRAPRLGEAEINLRAASTRRDPP
jgi:hypothetical protein